MACSSPDLFVQVLACWLCIWHWCWPVCWGTQHQGGVSVHHTCWWHTSGVPCSSLDLFVWVLRSCGWWPAGCVSSTGVGPFVVVLSTRVVSVFIVLVSDVLVVTMFVWMVHSLSYSALGSSSYSCWCGMSVLTHSLLYLALGWGGVSVLA